MRTPPPHFSDPHACRERVKEFPILSKLPRLTAEEIKKLTTSSAPVLSPPCYPPWPMRGIKTLDCKSFMASIARVCDGPAHTKLLTVLEKNKWESFGIEEPPPPPIGVRPITVLNLSLPETKLFYTKQGTPVPTILFENNTGRSSLSAVATSGGYKGRWHWEVGGASGSLYLVSGEKFWEFLPPGTAHQVLDTTPPTITLHQVPGTFVYVPPGWWHKVTTWPLGACGPGEDGGGEPCSYQKNLPSLRDRDFTKASDAINCLQLYLSEHGVKPCPAVRRTLHGRTKRRPVDCLLQAVVRECVKATGVVPKGGHYNAGVRRQKGKRSRLTTRKYDRHPPRYLR